MSSYCTFFDKSYLAQGLALARSLQGNDPEAVISVLALDEETATVVGRIRAPGVRVVSMAELLSADPQLEAVRSTRSRAEFIFTLKPCLCRYLLREDHRIAVLMYLDSDVFFFGNPDAILNELGDHSILLARHRYPQWHDESARYGRYNAGVLAFRNDAIGLSCLEWWRARCLESCALTGDGTHYGDQKYLDEWPARFDGVVISQQPGVNLAPWNWASSRVAPAGATDVQADGAPLVVFHFAQFRRISEGWWDSGQLEYGIMPRELRARIYEPYAAALDAAVAEIRQVRPEFSLSRLGWRAALGRWHLALLRLFWGQYWSRSNGRWWAGRCGLGRFSGHAMGVYRRWQRRGK